VPIGAGFQELLPKARQGFEDAYERVKRSARAQRRAPTSRGRCLCAPSPTS
jgi:hypothetical protein